MKTRLNKYIAQSGICSRRQADELIRSGKVQLNGRRAVLGDAVGEGDEVRVRGKVIRIEAEKVYVMLHKPVGYITTSDPKAKDGVMDLISVRERVFPVGRLDVQSSGLLLLTNDGTLANELMHPRYGHEKEYSVTTESNVSDGILEHLRRGVELEDGTTAPATVTRTGDNRFRICIREGRNRQIRRMLEKLEHEVTRLKRIRVGGLKIAGLKRGEWRLLTKDEIRQLKGHKPSKRTAS